MVDVVMTRPLLILVLLAIPVFAQEGPKGESTKTESPEKKRPPRNLRILPVGESPPYRQEIRDGVRYELPPPPGSVPPMEVSFVASETEKTGCILRMGMVSEAIPVQEGPAPVVLRNGPTTAEDAPPWITLNLPETGNALIVVWRSDQGWAKPRWIVLGDGAEACPAGTVRVVNVSPARVALEAGPLPRLVVDSIKVGRVAVGASAGIPFRLFYQDVRSSEWKQFRNSGLAQGTGERTTFVVYRADGVAPVEPLKTVILRERAPLAPVAPASVP